ncbi:hypothetical protein EYC80_004912 [Monilinia laxa]|uniref:Uncharacterized protein n=1 Tax=Monilinia laxa TaxID=61186 RepID=A0A5N6KJY1_MONLA|nr:hypothetical protein EYC80_004912 [Monilinia laxa]
MTPFISSIEPQPYYNPRQISPRPLSSLLGVVRIFKASRSNSKAVCRSLFAKATKPSPTDPTQIHNSTYR